MENYRSWSIYVQAILNSKAYWNIVVDTRKTSSALDNNASDEIKKEYQEYTQSHTMA